MRNRAVTAQDDGWVIRESAFGHQFSTLWAAANRDQHATTYRRIAKAATVLNARPRQLKAKMEAVCLKEIQRARDEVHIGAALSDIETIDDTLGFRLAAAKVEGNKRLEMIFFGYGFGDGGNDNGYYETPDLEEKIGWLLRGTSEEVNYVDEVFEGFIHLQA